MFLCVLNIYIFFIEGNINYFFFYGCNANGLFWIWGMAKRNEKNGVWKNIFLLDKKYLLFCHLI